MSTELIEAIRRGDNEKVRTLLSAGADPNYQFDLGREYGEFFNALTPLMFAAAAPKSNVEIVRSLVEFGADVTALSAGGTSAIWYAAGGGTGYPTGRAEPHETGSDIPLNDWGGGDAHRLRELLDLGGDPTETASNGRSCLYEACSLGDPERVRLLLERLGANLSQSALPKSAKTGFSLGLEKLLLRIAGGNYLCVPLFAAAKSGNLECVELLVEAGIPADYTSSGENALNHVGSADVAEYLWDAGVRLLPGTFGFDAIDNAIDQNNLTVLRLLLPKFDRAYIQRKLLTACGVYMNPAAVEILLSAGADANEVDPDYGSSLHYACWQGDGNGGREDWVVEKTVQTLISHGADVNLLSRGTRPIHQAVSGDWSSPTSLRVLIRNGVQVDAVNDEGRTALMLAVQGADLECVKMLLAAGADRKARDHEKKSAQDYASASFNNWKAICKKRFPKIIDKFCGDRLSLEDAYAKSFHSAKEISELLAKG